MNADQYFDHWNKIWRDLMRGVSLLEDKHLEYRPAEGYERTVGDILQHIINLELGWIHYVVRREHDGWPDEASGIAGNVKSIQSEMERVHKETTDYLSTLPVEEFTRIVQVPGDGAPKLSWILWHVLEQQIHHRGELFLCLSLLGLERPKTDRPE
jgi:uncharacterized damage-inducible protein DinB